MKISTRLSTFYTLYNDIIANYQLSIYQISNNNNTIDFDKFITNINSSLEFMSNYICKSYFYDNDENWNMSDMYDWILALFYKNGSKQGLILVNNNALAIHNLALMNKVLTNMVCNKIRYLNTQKRKANNYIMSPEDNKMNEVQDIKNYIDSIDSKLTFMNFLEKLDKKEYQIFKSILFAAYNNKTLDVNLLIKKLYISKRTYYRMLNSIKLKLQSFINK